MRIPQPPSLNPRYAFCASAIRPWPLLLALLALDTQCCHHSWPEGDFSRLLLLCLIRPCPRQLRRLGCASALVAREAGKASVRHAPCPTQKGVQTLSSQRRMATTLGCVRPQRKPNNFQKVGVVPAIFSYPNLISHGSFVEQTKFNRMQAEKKPILSPCCPSNWLCVECFFSNLWMKPQACSTTVPVILG